MAWDDVHGPARGVVYGLLRSQDPGLTARIHDHGWAGHPLKPLGISPPLFAGAKARKGTYTTSANGTIWLGSPIPQLAGLLLAALAGRVTVDWGRIALSVRGVQMETTPDHSAGEGVFESVSPIIVKHEDRYLLPGDRLYEECQLRNLRHKADVLKLPSEVELEVLEAGPRRRFDVHGAMRIGATAKIRVSAAPALLDAVRDWGLGLYTVQGFGCVR